MADRIDEFKGRVKEGVGKLTGDEELETEGEVQAEGARAGRKIKGAATEAGGVIKETFGKLTGDEVTEAEGKADRLKGKVERSG